MTKVVLTQKQRILKILSAGKKLTQAQARNYNILSLSSRINELRQDGVAIDSTPHQVRRVRDGKTVYQTVVQYSLSA